jgi:CO dehydrogenase maturation factor
MGGIKRAGGGCSCPENVFLRELLSHILTELNQFVLVDMEAGIEHLGRATAERVDLLIIVTEPSVLSFDSARRIAELAQQLGIGKIATIANKTGSEEETKFLKREIGAWPFMGSLPFSQLLRDSSLQLGRVDADPTLKMGISRIADFIIKTDSSYNKQKGNKQ